MNEDAYLRAKRIARAKAKLKGHVISSISILLVLLIINLMTDASYLWVQWPMMGLGISIIFHALSVYKVIHLENYEEKAIKKELRKMGEIDNHEEELELNERLELDELPELRKEWKDSDFV